MGLCQKSCTFEVEERSEYMLLLTAVMVDRANVLRETLIDLLRIYLFLNLYFKNCAIYTCIF